MWKLGLVTLALSATSAVAEPPMAPRQPPPVDRCPAEGPIVFAIDHRADANASVETSHIALRANGSFVWTVATSTGKPGPTGTGCLPPATNQKVTAALKAAPWTVTRQRITCKARSVKFTVFSANDKEVFTQKVCGGETLDAKSQAALDLITPLIDHPPG